MKQFSTLIMATMLGIASFLFLPSSALAHHRPNVSYQYLVGTGLLCELPFPNPCPAISEGLRGDRIELSGQGTFTTNPKTVTGGGTFVHKSETGAVIGQGEWHAMELLSFKSWGTSPDLPANFEGGVAKLRIHLAPASGGSGFFATLKIFCTIGDFPSTAHEGIKMVVRRAPNFSQIISGLTVFIRTD